MQDIENEINEISSYESYFMINFVVFNKIILKGYGKY